MRRRFLLLFLLLPWLPKSTWAQTPVVTVAPTPAGSSENLSAAEKAYDAKDYAEAIRLYQAEASTAPTAHLYQRIGNCDYVLGDVSQALGAYRQSLALDAGNQALARFVEALQARQATASNQPAPASSKDRVRPFGIRVNLSALQADIPAFNGDSAEYDVQAGLLGGATAHPAGPPQGGLLLDLEPTWRMGRRWELGLEAGFLGLGRYEIHYEKVDSLSASYKTTATPVGPNLRWYFHLGPQGTRFHLMAGAFYAPVHLLYHRADQIGALGVVQDGTLTAHHWGWHAGLGADLSLGGRWTLHPEFRWRQLRVSNIKGNLTVTGTVGNLSQTKTDSYKLWQDKNNEIVSRKSGLDGDPGWSPLELELNGLETVVGVSYGF